MFHDIFAAPTLPETLGWYGRRPASTVLARRGKATRNARFARLQKADLSALDGLRPLAQRGQPGGGDLLNARRLA